MLIEQIERGAVRLEQLGNLPKNQLEELVEIERRTERQPDIAQSAHRALGAPQQRIQLGNFGLELGHSARELALVGPATRRRRGDERFWANRLLRFYFSRLTGGFWRSSALASIARSPRFGRLRRHPPCKVEKPGQLLKLNSTEGGCRRQNDSGPLREIGRRPRSSFDLSRVIPPKVDAADRTGVDRVHAVDGVHGGLRSAEGTK